MKMMEDIRPVSYVKANTAEILAQINETRRPVIITQNGVPSGVLQDPESYERTTAAINMMKILAPGLEDAREGRVVEQSKVFADLRAELAGRRKLVSNG
jgi:prevent-host-death family protein